MSFSGAMKKWYRRSRKTVRGAVAIEFALLFIVFFALFYAIVSYAIVMMLQSAFMHAAEEGARSAIAVDRLAYSSSASYFNDGVDPQVRTTVDAALDWLPSGSKSKVSVEVEMPASMLSVRVVYAGYTSDPLVPILTLPFIGQVPKLPDDLAGTARINL
jgi:Flp pilus assembly protein TadG